MIARGGVKSREPATFGQPIRKPWTFYTNVSEILQAFAGKRCLGLEVHPTHAPCSGRNTEESGNYTRRMAVTIHKVWAKHAQNVDNKFVLLANAGGSSHHLLLRDSPPPCPAQSSVDGKVWQV